MLQASCFLVKFHRAHRIKRADTAWGRMGPTKNRWIVQRASAIGFSVSVFPFRWNSEILTLELIEAPVKRKNFLRSRHEEEKQRRKRGKKREGREGKNDERDIDSRERKKKRYTRMTRK